MRESRVKACCFSQNETPHV